MKKILLGLLLLSTVSKAQIYINNWEVYPTDTTEYYAGGSGNDAVFTFNPGDSLTVVYDCSNWNWGTDTTLEFFFYSPLDTSYVNYFISINKLMNIEAEGDLWGHTELYKMTFLVPDLEPDAWKTLYCDIRSTSSHVSGSPNMFLYNYAGVTTSIKEVKNTPLQSESTYYNLLGQPIKLEGYCGIYLEKTNDKIIKKFKYN